MNPFSKEEQSKRLRMARMRAGYKGAIDFIRKHGLEEGTYRHHDNGKRGLDAAIAARYGKFLNVDPWWLLSGQESENEKMETIQITHYIGKNGELHELPEKKHKPILSPAGLPEKLEAAIIDGDDMFPILRKGWVVFYVRSYITNIPHIKKHTQVNYNLPDSSDLYSEFLGKPCLVETEDGRVLLRELKPGSERLRYTLRSHNAPDIENVKIRAAYKIIFIQTDFAYN